MATIKTYLGDGLDLYRDHHSVILKYGPMAIPLTRRAIIELYERTHDLQDFDEAPTPTRTVPLMIVRANRDDELSAWAARGKRASAAKRPETKLEDLA